MTLYIVERMTQVEYNKMMGGAMFYHVEEDIIAAETKEEALAKAKVKYPEYHINPYVITLDERKAKEEADAKAVADRKAKEENAKARKIANDKAKAEALGLTEEEYKEYKKAKTGAKRCETEIETALAEIEELKRRIEYYTEKKAKYEAEVKKVEG